MISRGIYIAGFICFNLWILCIIAALVQEQQEMFKSVYSKHGHWPVKRIWVQAGEWILTIASEVVLFKTGWWIFFRS